MPTPILHYEYGVLDAKYLTIIHYGYNEDAADHYISTVGEGVKKRRIVGEWVDV